MAGTQAVLLKATKFALYTKVAAKSGADAWSFLVRYQPEALAAVYRVMQPSFLAVRYAASRAKRSCLRRRTCQGFSASIYRLASDRGPSVRSSSKYRRHRAKGASETHKTRLSVRISTWDVMRQTLSPAIDIFGHCKHRGGFLLFSPKYGNGR